jgi:hypothetical protein
MTTRKFLVLKKGNTFHNHFAFYNNKYRYMSQLEMTKDIVIEYNEEIDPLIAKGIRPKPDQHQKYYERLLVLQELMKSLPISNEHTRWSIYMLLYKKKNPVLLTRENGFSPEGIASCFTYWWEYICQDKVKNNKNEWYGHYYRLDPNTAFLFSNKNSFYLTYKNPLIQLNDKDMHEFINEDELMEDDDLSWRYDKYLKVEKSVHNKLKKGVLKVPL